jgi:hypothetical protein
MRQLLLISVVSAVMLAVPALAGTVTISPFGGGMSLSSGNLASTVFGTTKPAWGVGSLASVHSTLNAAGIDTDGKITFVAADTNQGLALMVLVDQESGVLGGTTTGRVQMTSTVAGAGVQYINTIASPVTVTGTGITRTARANFQWNGNGGADAFAWSNLQSGDSVSFQFVRDSRSQALLDSSTFQFVTWNGSGWVRASLASNQALFDESGNYDFGALIAVPLPSPLMLGSLPLLGLAACYRRRPRA